MNMNGTPTPKRSLSISCWAYMYIVFLPAKLRAPQTGKCCTTVLAAASGYRFSMAALPRRRFQGVTTWGGTKMVAFKEISQ